MKLTRKDKGELFAEAIVTGMIVYFFYLGSEIVFKQVLFYAFPNLKETIWGLKLATNIYSFKNYALFFVGLLTIIVIIWRLKRRIKQMQLNHIIEDLHYIAQGHYEHRIPFALKGDMGKVVESIHTLVSSTVDAMEEERAIEKSKDELITNVSHDIRTPLTSIIGYLGLIEDKQYKNEEELLAYTHVAYLKAKQMSLLVEDLFEYTKVRQRSTPLTITKFNLVQLLEQLEVEFQMDAEQKGVTFNLEVSDLEIFIEADAEKLVRVFNNLLSNALKYGKDATLLEIKAQKFDEQVMISVSNNGAAIPENSLKMLFERFYRVETSRSTETGGTGLGLAIAQSIVELHDGTIHAQSNEKKTAFIIYLPIKSKEILKN
ncbi:sensor histidine kinase [Isobaculum melis]|uniref:histidine kinase n=1 Tax=Isobaculum melis TaxID=142588 RepID=A0A1H9UKW8_9LACT|nr:HAMP domain-containing sensor histidine kinase [Isobaculum melis]SES09767.1 His Kinase A (phospho-acceptor) domain-containing protein [Isobaculum melis]